MLILDTTPAPDAVLDAVDDGVRALQDAGLEPRFILVGPEAYRSLRKVIGARFGRGAGYFEQYQFLTIVVDPLRGGAVCVVPSPREVAEEVQAERR
jgi:hypothetical protein